MTKTFKVGNIIDTPKGAVKILEYSPRVKTTNTIKQARAIIKFVDSGWVCNVQCSNIKLGKIVDARQPSVYGVGYLDTNITIPERGNSIIRKIYDLWANMLKRCYGKYPSSYQGCTVDKRWHSFRVFLNTITKVPNYAQWEQDSSLHLDKDIRVAGNKIYSLDTCMFVSPHNNVCEALDRRWHKN